MWRLSRETRVVVHVLLMLEDEIIRLLERSRAEKVPHLDLSSRGLTRIPGVIGTLLDLVRLNLSGTSWCHFLAR